MENNTPKNREAAKDRVVTEKRDTTARDVLSDISGSAKAAYQRGKADAANAVDQALPTVKRSISKGVYISCYYLAFGAVYSAKMVMELVPEDSVIRDGLRHGSEAANEAYARRLTDGDEVQNYGTPTTPGD